MKNLLIALALVFGVTTAHANEMYVIVYNKHLQV